MYHTLIQQCEGINPYEVDANWLIPYGDLLPITCILYIYLYLVGKQAAKWSDMIHYESSPGYRCLKDGAIDWVKYLSLVSKVLCFSEVQYNSYMEPVPKVFHCWALLGRSGCVLGAWCSCDAGHSQSCTHVQALLFTIEYDYRLNA